MFPFNISDLAYFIIRRKDGLTIRYNIIRNDTSLITSLVKANETSTYANNGYVKKSFSEWCKHNPAEEPLYSGKYMDLYIADAPGFRGDYKEFDIAIDCGNILSAYQVNANKPKIFEGEDSLKDGMDEYVIPYSVNDPKILRIDWDDRRAPRLKPEFWPELVSRLTGTTLIACQGGHGRSGTGAVCMMMVMNKDYTPADAIVHLRAVHCARAIESKEQHEYIGKVGEYLGRVNDIERIGQINSFKDEFFKMTYPSAKPYQDRLKKQIEEGKIESEDKKPYAYSWEM